MLPFREASVGVSGLETSPQAPAYAAHNGNLYIAWKGDGNVRVLFNVRDPEVTCFFGGPEVRLTCA
jgi:hypothetical protein